MVDSGIERHWCNLRLYRISPVSDEDQRELCKEDFSFVRPLPHTHPLYQDAIAAHEEHEVGFRYLRERYGTFGKDKSSSLRRWSASVPAQQLRAQVSIVLNWFKFHLRRGWLKGLRSPAPIRPSAVRASAPCGSPASLPGTRRPWTSRTGRRLSCSSISTNSASL